MLRVLAADGRDGVLVDQTVVDQHLCEEVALRVGAIAIPRLGGLCQEQLVGACEVVGLADLAAHVDALDLAQRVGERGDRERKVEERKGLVGVRGLSEVAKAHRRHRDDGKVARVEDAEAAAVDAVKDADEHQ